MALIKVLVTLQLSKLVAEDIKVVPIAPQLGTRCLWLKIRGKTFKVLRLVAYRSLYASFGM